jgi:outer membrane protein
MRVLLLAITFWTFLPYPAVAQERLSLSRAVAEAMEHNPELRSSRAAESEAGERVAQARAAYLPRVDFVQEWQRGDQPVFVFGSLLAQRRFSEANFALPALNYPDAVGIHRTGLSIRQLIFDGARTRSEVRSAVIGRQVAALSAVGRRSDVALATTEAFGQVLRAGADRRAAEAAVQAAEEDVRRAERRRDAGMATQADVLSLQVHAARMQERRIRAESDETVARATLNRLMGSPLDEEQLLDEAIPHVSQPGPIAEMEAEALANRVEPRQASLHEELARTARTAARSAFLPQIALQGAYELNGPRAVDGVSSWAVGAELRWNIFGGLADTARMREAGHAEARARADRDSAEAGIRVEVRSAAARLQSAIAREAVGHAAAAQARESQRMIRDRYEAGLATVSDVLRAADAVLDAEAHRTAALVDVLVSRSALERALGRQP